MATQCPKCSADNPDTKQFCGDCGTQLTPSDKFQPPVTRTLETPVEGFTRGSTFAGRYEIIEELGTGGMGKVYRVHDKKIDEEIAIKFLRPDIASDKRTIERFKNEIRIARKIGHRNVCRMYDLNEEDDTSYITMEYIPGEDLKSFIRRSRRLDAGTAITIAKQVSDGLAEAHRLGVVHRDLKSNNIMIDKDGSAQIMDFGIARAVEAKGLTGEGIIIGTPEYMSPEQAEAKEVDQRSDIYSLGIILYEMVTGQLPFDGDTPLSIAMKHKGEIPQDPKVLNPQIPDSLNQLIIKCLDKDKENRFQSARELLFEFDDIEKGFPTTDRKIAKKKPKKTKEVTLSFNIKKPFIPVSLVIIAVIVGLIIWHPWAPKKVVPISPDKPSLAILYFQNSSGNESLDPWRMGISDLMIMDLAQSTLLDVLAGDRVFGILKKLDLLDSPRYSSEDLREFANMGGVNHVCYGSYLEAGNKLIINFTLKNPLTDEIITTLKKECTNEEDIPSIVVESTTEIKEALDLTPQQISSDIDERLKSAVSNSAQAFKYYSQGRFFRLKGDRIKAEEFWLKAVEEDPEFASAYRALSKVSRERVGRQKYLQKAFDFREGLSDYERLNIEGDYYMNIGEQQRGIEIYERLLQRSPDQTVARINTINYYNRAYLWEKALPHVEIGKTYHSENWMFVVNARTTYAGLNQYEKAAEILQKFQYEIEDIMQIHQHLTSTYLDQAKYELAHVEADKTKSMSQDEWSMLDQKGDIYFLQGDYQKAQEHYQMLLEFDSVSAQRLGSLGLGYFYLFQGKFEDAENELRKEASFQMDLARILQKARSLEDALKEYEKAWRLVEETGTAWNQSDILCRLGIIQSEIGMLEEAQETAAKLKIIIKDDPLVRRYNPLHHQLEGMIAFHQENYAAAIDLFKKALDASSYGPFRKSAEIHYHLAEAYSQSGNIEEAKKELGKIAVLSTGRLDHGDLFAKSFYMLGKLWEEQGDTSKARENYEKFLDLWKDADPGLPEVDDARSRLLK